MRDRHGEDQERQQGAQLLAAQGLPDLRAELRADDAADHQDHAPA